MAYGPVQPEYKEYHENMRQWYAEGLINSEHLQTDSSLLHSKMTRNIGGCFNGLPKGGLGKIMNSMLKNQPDFELRPVQYPKCANGQVYNSNTSAQSAIYKNGMAITAKCKDLEFAVKYNVSCERRLRASAQSNAGAFLIFRSR